MLPDGASRTPKVWWPVVASLDSCDWRCASSVIALGHIDGNVRIFAYSPHNRLAILSVLPTDSKEDSLEQI
jgi:hypothetical protein